jgi:hypothetical protein
MFSEKKLVSQKEPERKDLPKKKETSDTLKEIPVKRIDRPPRKQFI